MPIVKMPDGQMVELPDNPTAEQLTALRAKVEGMGQQVAQEASNPLAPYIQGAKVAGAGMLQGALSLPAMAAEKINKNPLSAFMPDPIAKLYGMASEKLGVMPDPVLEPGTIEQQVKRLDVKPQTPAEKYLHSIGEGVGAAALLPIGGFGQATMQGAAAGLGSEVSAQAFGDNPMARVLGGLGGGLGVGVAGSILPQRGNVARELMRDVRQQDFNQAVAGQQRNIQAGMPTNLSQTMPSASNIDSGVELLANSRHGRAVTEQLRNQPGQAELEMEAALSKLPGSIRTEQEVANAAQEASTAALVAAKKARSAAVTPLYEQAGELGKPVLKTLRDILAETVQKPGTSVDTIRTVQALGRELAESSATGLPRTHALDIKAAIDDTIRAGIKNTVNPVSPKTQGELKFLASRLYEELGNNSDALKKANAVFKQITDDTVNPLKQSVVGRIAGRAGYQADQEAATSKIFSLFNKGTPEGAASSDILTLERSLRKTNPQAFQDAAKSWIAEKVTAAVKSDTARGPEDVSREFVKVFGNPGQSSKEWSTMKDVLAGLALSEGKAANTYVDGFKSLMRLNAEMAIRPASVKGVTSPALASMSQDSLLSRIGTTSAITPLRQPALALARATGASVLKDMDKWLTTPEGAATLARLGRQPYMSPGWLKTLQTLSATEATVE